MANDSAKQLLIVMVAGIGDFILGSMGLRALKAGHPACEVHLLTSVEAAEIGVYYPYVDRVWGFPIRRLRRDKTAFVEIARCLSKLHAWRFDKIVNLYQVASFRGALAMGLTFSVLRSPCKIGHDRYGFGTFLDRKVPADFFRGRHMADALLELACLAGGRPDGRGIEVFHSGRPKPALKKIFDDRAGKKTVAVNAGSDVRQKRASPVLFASIVNELARCFPIETIVLGGPGEEALAAEVVQRIEGPAINVAGKTKLEELVYVIEHIDLLITNDSGPMHIAAAMDKPLVALFSGGYPAAFGPYGDGGRFRIVEIDGAAVKGSAGPYCAAVSEKAAAMGKDLLAE